MSSTRFAAAWAAHELAEFLAVVADCGDESSALVTAVERAAEAFEAEVAAVVREGDVRAIIGVPAAHGAPLLEVATGGIQTVSLVDLGDCSAIAAGVDGDPPMRLVVARAGDEPFSPEERGLARSMGRVLALTLRNHRLFDSLTERQVLIERLALIQRSIAHRAELDEVLDSITVGLVDLIGGDVSMVRLLDPEDPTRSLLAASRGVPDEVVPLLRSLPLTSGVTGQAIRTGKLVVSEDYAASPDHVPAALAIGTRSAMAAPVHENGEIVGSVLVTSRDPERGFSATEQEVLLAFAEHISLALTDARAIEGMERALYDPLTKLPNRTLFTNRLETALASRQPGRRVAVLFVDLDRFKSVNDSLGHAAGDELLVAVAQRLSTAVRAGDTVARMGGDEFMVLVAEARSPDEVEALAERIHAVLAAPFVVGGREVVPSASIGIAFDDPACADGSALVHRSDVAMYHAKQTGRGRHATYRESLGEIARRRLGLETGLRHALERGGLSLHYQPIVALADRSIVSVEALLRWEDPNRAPAPVSELIAIAEESELIIPLGRWVIERACAAQRTLTDACGGAAVPIHVNVSVRQLRDRRFVDHVAESLNAAGIDPSALIVELTESILIGSYADEVLALEALREIGVGIALDDFGQGYSSLAYLARLDADQLKLDRTLTAQVGDTDRAATMLRHLTAMAGGLGMRVVAEGVESDEQAHWLRGIGCDLAQGYLFHRPMPFDDLIACISQATRGAAPVNAR